MTPEDKLARFGPQTVYPNGGKHILLRYYNESKGHRILLARTETALRQAWRTSFASRYGSLSVKSIWDINIIDLPEYFKEDYAEKAYEDSVADLGRVLSSTADYLTGEGYAIPSGIARCTNYRSKYDYPEHVTQDRGHYNCANCECGYVVVANNLAEIHDKVIDWWMDRSRGRRKKIDPPKDRAGFSCNDGPIYHVWVNQGHHREGVVIRELEECYGEGAEFFLPENILFVFQGKQRAAVDNEYQDLIKNWEAECAEADRTSKYKRERERRSEDVGMREMLACVLAGKTPPPEI